MSKKKIKVAFAGNPNVGKTTLLNAIAGTSLKVGNWPGVTVEKREAIVEVGDYILHFVDLPGIYTLDPLSEDEKIAVKFLEEEKPDVIVNVIETPSIERALLLTTELLEFRIPTVIALNMWDEAQKVGVEVDIKKLSELLGVEVVTTVGKSGKGVKELVEAVIRAFSEGKTPKEVRYSAEVEDLLKELSQKNPTATKHDLIKELLREKPDLYEKVRDDRFAFAHGLAKEVVRLRGDQGRDLTDALDKIVLHPLFGIPIFIGIIYITFKLAFDFSSPFVDWLDGFINDFLSPLSLEVLKALSFPEWFVRFFSEALVGGVGFVITFVPLIGSLYFLITFLEMSGYIPRVAFLMDRFMHKIGLHGKSVIPLILGFGCNVPAIVATRTIENPRDKLLVIAMIPFMSCPARLVVFSFFVSIFFRENPALVITAMYVIGIFIAVLTALILRKVLVKEGPLHFVMELPPYRFPSMKTVFTITWAHVKDFLYRAGTLIFGASIIVWLLLNLPPGVKNPSESIAGKIGKALVHVFEPVGIDNWKATTSLIPAFLAREIAISSMGTIYMSAEGITEEVEEFNFKRALFNQGVNLLNATEDAFSSLLSLGIVSLEVEEEQEEDLKSLIAKDFNPASALSFMIFILIYTSCLGTFAVMSREIGLKGAIAFLGYSFAVAWITAFISYNLLSRLTG